MNVGSFLLRPALERNLPEEGGVPTRVSRSINDYSVDQWLTFSDSSEISEQVWGQLYAAFTETYHPISGTSVRSGGRRFCDVVDWPDEHFVRKEFSLLAWLHFHQHRTPIENSTATLEQLRDRVLLALNLPTWGNAGRVPGQASSARTATAWEVGAATQPSSSSASVSAPSSSSLHSSHGRTPPSSLSQDPAAPTLLTTVENAEPTAKKVCSSGEVRYTKQTATHSTGEKAPPRQVESRSARATPVVAPIPPPMPPPVQVGDPQIACGGRAIEKPRLWFFNRELFRRIYGDVTDQVQESTLVWDMQPVAFDIARNDPIMKALYELIQQRRILMVDSEYMSDWAACGVLLDQDGCYVLFHSR